MSTNTAQELANRKKQGFEPLTLAQLDARLRSIGFTLDRSVDCHHTARWITGEYAGQSYPAISTGIKHIDSGLSFAHVDLPESAKLAELQAMRGTGELFAVVNGAILEC